MKSWKKASPSSVLLWLAYFSFPFSEVKASLAWRLALVNCEGLGAHTPQVMIILYHQIGHVSNQATRIKVSFMATSSKVQALKDGIYGRWSVRIRLSEGFSTIKPTISHIQTVTLANQRRLPGPNHQHCGYVLSLGTKAGACRIDHRWCMFCLMFHGENH